MKNLYHSLITGLFLSFFLLAAASEVKASPADYGRDFGLIVHQQNQDLAVPLSHGKQVLESYFAGKLLKASADEMKQFMSQREFLLAFAKGRMAAKGDTSHVSDPVLYPLMWLEARRNNWLPDTTLTYQTLREFLYRYSVSEAYGGIPYFEGLVLDAEEISTLNYPSLRQVQAISEDLSARMAALRRLTKPSLSERTLLADLVVYAERFDILKSELRALYHPLNVLPDLPEDIQQKIVDYDLNEVLDQVSYNYSHNNANRIHNLVTGASQMSGRVFQPDEVIDFEKELGRNGWGIYKYGWVILGGTEAWQFGGGLCGSATLTFTPSWRSGLEIIRRYAHSVYYKSLYPEESFALDATIYRGHKNLIMRNSTGSPLLYYAQNDPEAKEITMYLIGNSPYKHIEIEGPIQVSWGNYKWIRRMERFDGTVVEDVLTTRYGLIY